MTTPGGVLIGQWLGEFHLHTLLGVGGMAEVYQAHDAALGREVAVKVLPAELAADPTFVERFRREARAVGALNHPNIVPVHHFGEQGPLLYLVMPLMKESLRDRLKRGAPLPVEEAVRIAVQILSGLGAAHAQRVVHRDVKPENILLDDQGVAKLTDFGISRRLTLQSGSGGPTLAGTGLPVGTPQYMAPEQLRGDEVDQRADIYALGAVLYEMLTGLPPHIADSPFEVASLVLTAPIAPPSERNPAIWPELEQALLRALSSKRLDRYANATSFAESLQDALLAHSIEALSSSAPGAPVRLGSVRPDGQPHNPTESPTVPVAGAPPAGTAGKPPRWPPSNQPRDNGAGGGGPGRRILIFALIGALVVLTACAGVAYAMGVFPPGGGTRLASATATVNQGKEPTETFAPTTTTGPGTPTSTPAPTNTAKSGATAAASNTPPPGATATSTPSSPTLSVQTSIVLTNNSGVCGGAQTITNNGPQLDGWTWVVTGPSLPPSFEWSLSPPPWNAGLPQATSQPQGFMWSLRVRFYCSEYAGPYTLHLHDSDSYGNDFPTGGNVTMSKP